MLTYERVILVILYSILEIFESISYDFFDAIEINLILLFHTNEKILRVLIECVY